MIKSNIPHYELPIHGSNTFQEGFIWRFFVLRGKRFSYFEPSPFQPSSSVVGPLYSSSSGNSGHHRAFHDVMGVPPVIIHVLGGKISSSHLQPLQLCRPDRAVRQAMHPAIPAETRETNGQSLWMGQNPAPVDRGLSLIIDRVSTIQGGAGFAEHPQYVNSEYILCNFFQMGTEARITFRNTTCQPYIWPYTRHMKSFICG